jgi:hypothetical protein
VTGTPRLARLSPQAAKTLTELPGHAAQMVREVLDMDSRTPWGWPQWNANDPEGEDIRDMAHGEAGRPPSRPSPVCFRISRPRA